MSANDISTTSAAGIAKTQKVPRGCVTSMHLNLILSFGTNLTLLFFETVRPGPHPSPFGPRTGHTTLAPCQLASPRMRYPPTRCTERRRQRLAGQGRARGARPRPVFSSFYRNGHLVSPSGVPLKCLVDTGASQTFLPWETAEGFGIDLDGEDDFPLEVMLAGDSRDDCKVVPLDVHLVGEDGSTISVPDVPVVFIKA